MSSWPNIAESMIGGGFESTVRRMDETQPADSTFSEQLAGLWSSSLESEMERISRRLSGLLLQILFNLPALAILGYTGWITVQRFLLGSYLTFDFFLHALWTIGIVLLLSFFLFQGCLGLFSGPERILRRSFKHIQQELDPLLQVSENPLFRQMEMVVALGLQRDFRDKTGG